MELVEGSPRDTAGRPEKEIRVYLGCHPCVNTASLRIKTKDVLERFLLAVGHAYRTVHMDEG